MLDDLDRGLGLGQHRREQPAPQAPTSGVTEYMRALAIMPAPSKVAIMHAMPPIYITFLNRLDIEALALSDAEIIAAIETSLAAQGRGQTVIEPRVHLNPGLSNGHFNVLRGAIAAPSTAPASRWWATSSTTTSSATLRARRRAAARSAHRRAQGDPRRRRHHRHADRRHDRGRRQVPRAQERQRCWATSARAARRTGTCACSTICSTSTRSASIPSGRRAARRSARGWPRTSARRSS
jgi:hypothetical protein